MADTCCTASRRTRRYCMICRAASNSRAGELITMGSVWSEISTAPRISRAGSELRRCVLETNHKWFVRIRIPFEADYPNTQQRQPQQHTLTAQLDEEQRSQARPQQELEASLAAADCNSHTRVRGQNNRASTL